MWFKRKNKITVNPVSIEKYTKSLQVIKQNPLFKDSLNNILDSQIANLDSIWWGEQDNDTLRAYQGQARALRELKILISHNPGKGVKEDTDGSSNG